MNTGRNSKMRKFRTEYKGKYALSKPRYLFLYYYILDKYPEWVAEYNSLSDTRKALKYYADDVPPTDMSTDATQAAAMRMAVLSRKIDMVRDAAYTAAGEIAPWIIQAATHEGIGYNTLRMQENRIPCGKNKYYAARRKFYWLLSKKIW